MTDLPRRFCEESTFGDGSGDVEVCRLQLKVVNTTGHSVCKVLVESRSDRGGASASYLLACCFEKLTQLSIHDGGVFHPYVGRIEVPVLSIDVGHAVLSLWVVERVALVESTSSRRSLGTLLEPELVVRDHNLA